MTLRADEIAAVAQEIARTLVGRTVQKVVQPDAVTVVLGFPRTWLLCAADTRAGRLHLVPHKPPGTGEAAPAFCMLLRKELIGRRLAAVNAVAGERAVELVFTRVGSDDQRRLWLFLFGKAAQLELRDGERALGAIGPGRRLHEALPPPRPDAAAGEDAVARPARFPADAPSVAIAAHYGDGSGAGVHGDSALRVQALAATRAALKQKARLAEALGRDRERALAAEGQRKWADLLLAHLAEVPRGARAVTLPDDFGDGAPVAITLDPALSAQDNAARFYKAYKRLSRARAAIESRLADAERARAELSARLERIAAASDEELATLAPPPRARPEPGRAGKRHAKDERPPPYREYRAKNGAAILVGRGADRNDELTFKVARGNDLWLHTRDVPGAHVVVPLASGRAIDGETLLDAATLAAHFSNARDEAQVDVAYVLRKHVRKPPRAAPGAVTHSWAKTVRVRLERPRLERLLASRVD